MARRKFGTGCNVVRDRRASEWTVDRYELGVRRGHPRCLPRYAEGSATGVRNLRADRELTAGWGCSMADRSHARTLRVASMVRRPPP